MKPPIFVRSFSEEERESLEAGLRSKDAFVLRQSQILLASSRGESPPKIARSLGCGSQTVRNAIHDFNEHGLDALVAKSSSQKDPGRLRPGERRAVALDAPLLSEGVRQGCSLWTLEMAAEVAFEQGLVERRVLGETIRATLVCLLGVRWLGRHNRRVKESGCGVRIVSCLLSKQSSWLNAIEPKWVHGKRKVVEPDGLLGAYELADRVCRAFDCPHYEHLSIPQEVT